MKAKHTGISFSLSPLDNDRLAAVTGERGVYLRQIGEYLGVRISHRAEVFFVEGDDEDVSRAEKVICELYEYAASNKEVIDANVVHLALVGNEDYPGKARRSVIKVRKTHISPRNAAQDHYLKQIAEKDVCFGIGPAGTGKTYLAVACASQALANHEVDRIILVRPAVEAGEKLGFLPGDIGQKVDPYLRPLYDALFEMLGADRVGKLIERSIIELAPLAYMRGRTLNNAYILLDEAQNTTIEQMKMFLTRMGQGSKMIVTGDTSQIDLPKHVKSGLLHVENILRQVRGVGFTHFTAGDVVRHSLVQRIVEAYEAGDRRDQARNDETPD